MKSGEVANVSMVLELGKMTYHASTLPYNVSR